MIRNEIAYKNITITAERFSGINDFLNEYDSRPISPAYKDHHTASIIHNDVYDEYRADFSGAAGYTDAADKLKNGVNVSVIKTARAAAVTGTKRAIVHSVNGGRVSVPSYLSGSPACMRRKAKKPAKTELNIFIDNGVSAGISPEQIQTAGARIVEYITELQEKYIINLTAGGAISETSSGRGNVYTYGIKIAEAGKPFSAARVSFCLTSPAFLRVFGFLWITRADGVPYMSGLGCPLSNNIERETEVLKRVYKNAIVISITDVIKNGKHALPEL